MQIYVHLCIHALHLGENSKQAEHSQAMLGLIWPNLARPTARRCQAIPSLTRPGPAWPKHAWLGQA